MPKLPNQIEISSEYDQRDSQWNKALQTLCKNHPLIVIIKAKDGYSVYFDDKQNYNTQAGHFNASSPLGAILTALEHDSIKETNQNAQPQKEN